MIDATNRDEAREYFIHRGMRYTSDPEYMIAYPIHWGDIMRLWQMCEDHISEADIEMRMRPNPKIKRIKFRDQVCEAYLRVDGPYCRFADMVVQQNNRRDRSNDVQVYLGQDGIYHASPNCGRKVVTNG